MKIFIVIQGPTIFYKELKAKYGKLNVVWSSWEDDEKMLINEKNVVINKKPFIIGKCNFFLQQKSSYNGLLMAKKLGATHAIKLRSDMVFSDIALLLEKLSLNKDTMYFPGWHNFRGGYFMDFFQFGKIDDMIKLWKIKLSLVDLLYNYKRSSKILNRFFNSARIPEKILTANYFKHFSGQKVKYILPILNDFGIKCRWLKYGTNFEDFIHDPLCRLTEYTDEN